MLNFKDACFWKYYQCFEQLTLDQFQCIGFKADIDIEGNLAPYTLELDCDDKYSLQIEILPYQYEDIVENLMINLSLMNRVTKEMKQLGWWDEACWHPFCLRWDELAMLSEHIARNNSQFQVEVVFLLLCRFTGICSVEFTGKNELEDRKEKVKKAYISIGIQDNVEELVDNTIFLQEDYQWIYNKETGWEFTGEYSCYSIRNSTHSDEKEGNFPYNWFNEMISKCRLVPSPSSTRV